MKIVCVSASNTQLPDNKSTSIAVCYLIKEIIHHDINEETIVDVVALRDYHLKSCILCGACFEKGDCIYDEDFNHLLKQLEDAQGIFLVVPHYSPIPAKLMMALEKVNEITYTAWLNDPNYQSPFYNKPVGIIGHGGMVESEANLSYYHDHLVTPVANTLKSLSFNVVRPNEVFENGITFGLKDESCLKKVENEVFPDIIQDWQMIEERIKPLITNVRKVIEME